MGLILEKDRYFYKDISFGRNDWEPVVSFVRAFLENTEDSFCFPMVRKYVLEDNTLLSQTFVQLLGKRKEIRGVGIIKEKLEQLGEKDLAHKSPWCSESLPWELLCLQSLAEIGGEEAVSIIEIFYQNDPKKAYLHKAISKLSPTVKPVSCVAPFPTDYPEILRPIRSYLDINGEGGFSLDMSHQDKSNIIQLYRKVRFKGIIEHISGDGSSTTFELKNKITDHIHNKSDPFSDFGIFMSYPKIEYPFGIRRWMTSHTFLWDVLPDGDLWGREYTWDTKGNTVTTHFHEHVKLEKVVLNPDGKSVTVKNRPISTGVELRGNVFYDNACSSAVRGVWDNPERKGTNYYVKRANILTQYKSIYYFRPFHTPIVQQWGIWLVDECEDSLRFFDTDGNCTDVNGVIEELLIPLHEPKVLAYTTEQYHIKGKNDKFARRITPKIWPDLTPVPDPDILVSVLGAISKHSCYGQAGFQQNCDNGYRNGLDINSDGIIDEADVKILQDHAGEVYRINVGMWGYFGNNWLSTGNDARSKDFRKDKGLFVCSYDYGAGYDAQTGNVRLFESPPKGNELYIEYYCDKPAAKGIDNIKVYLQPPV